MVEVKHVLPTREMKERDHEERSSKRKRKEIKRHNYTPVMDNNEEEE